MGDLSACKDSQPAGHPPPGSMGGAVGPPTCTVACTQLLLYAAAGHPTHCGNWTPAYLLWQHIQQTAAPPRQKAVNTFSPHIPLVSSWLEGFRCGKHQHMCWCLIIVLVLDTHTHRHCLPALRSTSSWWVTRLSGHVPPPLPPHPPPPHTHTRLEATCRTTYCSSVQTYSVYP